METLTDIDQALEALAAFEPTPFPVISAYVNLRSGDQGHDGVIPFLKSTMQRKGQRFEEGSDERRSFDEDAEKILALFEDEEGRFAAPQDATVAIFACSGEDLFEIIEYETPLEKRSLHVGYQPNIFQLAWSDERYSRYAVLALDSQTARVFAFGHGEKVASDEIEGKSLGRTKAGGWSQARYQRRRRNLKKEHVEEAIEHLEKVVDETGAERIILIGHERLISMAQKALPQRLQEMLADEVALDVNAPEHEVLEKSLEAFRRNDIDEDEERVTELLNEHRADGLATLGMEETLGALLNGQVEEVLLLGPTDRLNVDNVSNKVIANLPGDAEALQKTTLQSNLGDAIVRRAEQTGAEVRFIEKDERLGKHDGVGAFLRFRLS